MSKEPNDEALLDRGPMRMPRGVTVTPAKRPQSAMWSTSGGADHRQQQRFLQGLLEAFANTGNSSLLAYCFVAIGGDQNCRDMEAGPEEMLMQFKAGHFRHSQVDDQTFRDRSCKRPEKIVCR